MSGQEMFFRTISELGYFFAFHNQSYKYRGFRDNFMLNSGFRDNYMLNSGFHNKFRLLPQI